MKKTLLMLVAFMTTMTAFAQDEQEGWMKSFAPVADASDLAGIHTAVAGDGSVYASSTYNQAFQFAGKAVTDPEGLISSCVVKYDKDGNEQWSVSLVGACTVHSMVADTDGTLYIAGTATDEKVVLTGTDGTAKEIINPVSDPWGTGEFSVDAYSAFVAKISKDGVIEKVQVITPATNEEVAMDFENFYIQLDMIAVRPYKLMLDGDKLYVAARYMGDVSTLGWNGAYVHEDGMTIDVYSYGVFSMLKSDFSNIGSVANVQQTGTITNSEYDVEAIDFVVYNGVPHVAFIGFGNLTLTTAADSKNFEFKMEGASMNEHALVLANVNDLNKTKVFAAAPHDYLGATYDLLGATIAGENCILGGTFYGNFPLDNTVTKDKNTSFVASIKMSDCSVNWTAPNPVESEATCMIVTGEEIHAAANEIQKEGDEEKEKEVGKHYVFKTADGTLKKTENQGFNDAAVYNDTYCSTIFTDGANVCIFSPKMSPSGIEAIKAAAAKGETKIFNLNGQRVAKPQKGLYIINGMKVVVK